MNAYQSITITVEHVDRSSGDDVTTTRHYVIRPAVATSSPTSPVGCHFHLHNPENQRYMNVIGDSYIPMERLIGSIIMEEFK